MPAQPVHTVPTHAGERAGMRKLIPACLALAALSLLLPSVPT